MTRQAGFQAFTNKDVQDITGVYGRNIINYAEKGIITPNIQSSSGIGSTRLWDMVNLIEFAILKALQDSGISLNSIEKSLQWLNDNGFSSKLIKSIAYKFMLERHEWDLIQADEEYNEEEYDDGIDYDLFSKRIKTPKDEIRKKYFKKFKEPQYSKMYSPFSKCLFNLYLFHEITASSGVAEEDKEKLVSMIEPFVGFFAYDIRNVEANPDERHQRASKIDENRYETETFENAKRKQCLILEIIDGKEFRLIDELQSEEQKTLYFHTEIRLNLYSIAVDCYSKLLSMRTTEFFEKIFYPKLVSEMNQYMNLKGGASNGTEG